MSTLEQASGDLNESPALIVLHFNKSPALIVLCEKASAEQKSATTTALKAPTNAVFAAADAADAEPKMLFEYLFEYLFADWAGLTAVEIATRCGPWPSSRRASASPWCCSTTSQLDHNYLRRLLCVAAPGESVTVTETDVSKFIAYPRVFLYFTKVL